MSVVYSEVRSTNWTNMETCSMLFAVPATKTAFHFSCFHTTGDLITAGQQMHSMILSRTSCFQLHTLSNWTWSHTAWAVWSPDVTRVNSEARGFEKFCIWALPIWVLLTASRQ